MKINNITNWQDGKTKENYFLIWYYNDRKLTFEFFKSIDELKRFCKNYKVLGYTKALKKFMEAA